MSGTTPARTRLRSLGTRLGPGLVFALSTIGVGDFIANTAVGAQHGYQLLWLLIVAGTFRFVWLRSSALYTLVTGETLIQGYRRMGRWLVWVVLIAMTATQHFYSLFKYQLFGQCLNMVAPLGPHGPAVWTLVTVAAALTFLMTGSYARLERLLRWFVFVMGAGLVVAAVATRPDPSQIARGLFVPLASGAGGGYGTLLLVMAIIGTEVGSTLNVSYSYFVRAKGWRSVEHLQMQQRDLLIGVGTVFVIGALLQITAAGTLAGGPPPRDIDDLVRLFTPILGRFARYVFGVGLWSAAFGSTLAIAAGSGLIATDVCRTMLPRLQRLAGPAVPDRPVHQDPVYRTVILVWFLTPLYVLFTAWKPIVLGLLSSATGLVLMPLMSLALLRLTNTRALMGDRTNGRWSNIGLVLMCLVSSGFLARAVLDLLRAHGSWR
ncbi:MAG: Nramp family divalent metal transporter [Vicinamibacterales bacterium]